MYFRSLHFRETVIRCPALRGCRGKSGHHRAGFPTKAGGACFKTGSRPVPQKINRLTCEVRVKRWGKSPPPNEQSNGHGKPNPMQDEIGNRAARLWFRVRRTTLRRDPVLDRIDKWMTGLTEILSCRLTESGLQLLGILFQAIENQVDETGDL